MASRKTTVKRHRSIQRRVDKSRAANADNSPTEAMQVGGREYPVPPFPKQHLSKPGREAILDLAPYYDAPFYQGSQKLRGKSVVITGGDSGIGRAVAILFAREGADVAIVYLSEDADARQTQKGVEAEGRRCLLISGDVRSKKFCVQAAKKAAKEFGKIDILINNAAFQLHTAKIEELTEAHFDMTMKTNLYGYFFMVQAVLPFMPYGGAIVNNGSVTALLGSQSLLDYSTTKGGIHAFTRSLSSHLAGRGIRVNAVAPGPVWTPLNPADKKAADVSEFGAKTIMKRPAQPEEISPAFLFLASNQCSSYITGEILPVIGGYHGG